MYVCMYVRTYVCMYVRMYVCMYVCMHACMHVCMYVCMYIHTYVRTHECMCCMFFASGILYIPQPDGPPLASRPVLFSILATHFITRYVCLYNKIYKEKGESCDLYVEDELFIPSC
jgi:hypothetical protein